MELYSTDPQRTIESIFFEQLNNEMGAAWIIEKLFNTGTPEDVKAIRKYYGDERVKKEVIQIKWLSKQLVSLFSNLFDIPKEDFLTFQLIHKLS